MWQNLRRLWNDENGALLSSELVLVGTMTVAAGAVGIASFRDAVVTELADLGAMVGSLNQSFFAGGLVGHHSACSAQGFTDMLDSCDDGVVQGFGLNFSNSRGVQICANLAHQEFPHDRTPAPAVFQATAINNNNNGNNTPAMGGSSRSPAPRSRAVSLR